MDIQTAEALDLPTEVFLTDLDNGYVMENEPAEDSISFRDGWHAFSIGEGYRLITFHDCNGNENYLILADDFELRFHA